MATSITNKINVSELDFSSIKDTIINYMRGQGEFTDYDFAGSGLSVLLDILAYNTHYNSFYTNMIANEMFLDSAADRNNVVSRARQLGYIPSSSHGARASVQVQIDKPDDTNSLTIIKGHPFTTSIEGTVYTFLTTTSKTMELAAGVFSVDVDIIEGSEFTINYLMEVDRSVKYVIPNLNVDIDTISVIIRDSSVGTSIKAYSKVKNNTIVGKSDTVYWLEEGPDGKYQIYFGDDVIGQSPTAGEVIQITYNICNSSIGNGASVFDVNPIPYDVTGVAKSAGTNARVITTTVSSGGSERESINSIKFLAPLDYETQHRSVTANDYKSRILAEYSDVDAIRVWGGEDNDPPDYGAVYMSIKPKSGLALTDTEKNNIIKNILNRSSVVTVRKTIVDPEYIHIVLSAVVKYDSKLTNITENTIKSLVSLTINSFGQKNLDQFDSYFRHSKLLAAVDAAELSITNSLVSVKIKKILSPTFGIVDDYTLRFSNPIFHPHDGHMGAVISSQFSYTQNPNFEENPSILVRIYDDGYGKLLLKDEKGRLVVAEIGSVNYDTGLIKLNSFKPLAADDNVIGVTVLPSHDDIVTKNNQILSLLLFVS